MESDSAREQSPGSEKPQGRDAVRRSILAAARKHFARHGTRGSLRDIAATARVNVGLIHRHFGRKEQLVQEVIADGLAHSAKAIDPGADAPAAIRQMFLRSSTNTEFVRMIAWLSLENDGQDPSPLASSQLRTIRQVRELAPADEDQDLRLMVALTVLYGWSIFSREVLSAFDIDAEDRPAVEAKLADLLAQLVDTDRPMP